MSEHTIRPFSKTQCMGCKEQVDDIERHDCKGPKATMGKRLETGPINQTKTGPIE